MVTKTCHPANSCAGGYGNCLDVKITNACNANCAFCIEKGGYCPKERPVKELALETIHSDAETVLILGGRADAAHSSGGISGDDSSLEETYLYDHKWEHAQGWTP